MKNFNIEQLEKKTPYQIPENTFEETQRNVFDRIKHKSAPKIKILKLNYSIVTSIAAALALVFGFTFLWKTNQTQIDKPLAEVNATKQENNKNINNKNSLEKTDVTTIENLEKNTKTVEQANNISETKTNEKIAIAKTSEESYNELLNALSDAEIAELATNSDHDIYLDIYK